MKHSSSDSNIEHIIKDLEANKKALEALIDVRQEEIKKKDALIEKYKSALEKYADENSWSFGRLTNLGKFVGLTVLGLKGGYEVARQALAESESK